MLSHNQQKAKFDGEWEVFVGKAALHLFATPRTTSQTVTS